MAAEPKGGCHASDVALRNVDSGHGGVGSMARLDDLSGLFLP